ETGDSKADGEEPQSTRLAFARLGIRRRFIGRRQRMFGKDFWPYRFNGNDRLGRPGDSNHLRRVDVASGASRATTSSRSRGERDRRFGLVGRYRESAAWRR